MEVVTWWFGTDDVHGFDVYCIILSRLGHKNYSQDTQEFTAQHILMDDAVVDYLIKD